MSNYNALVGLMKQAATEAVDASKPMQMVVGTVLSVQPLRVQIDQKLTLGSAQLILTRNVTDHSIEMTVDHFTEAVTHTHDIHDTYTGGGSATENTHRHNYIGRKVFLVHNSLKVGEEVLMCRQQNGQKYIILDRLG